MATACAVGGAAFVQPLGGGWQVRFDMEGVPPHYDQMVLVRLRVEPVGSVPPGGLTQDVMRQVRLGPARRYAALSRRRGGTGAAVPRSDKRGRPRVLGLPFYRRVAKDYAALVHAGAPTPAKTLAEKFDYTRTGMRSLLKRCRQMGLLLGTGGSR